jgi:methylthioribose-1-phosphate isomerase
MAHYTVLEFVDGRLRMLDQRRLPQEMTYFETEDYRQAADAIREMVVRGAPAIGVAAAYAMALAALHSQARDSAALLGELEQAAGVLRAARPTAVNLFWAVERIMECIKNTPDGPVADLGQAVLREAGAIAAENAWLCKQIGLNALELVPEQATFIHHCNTGALATVEYGTALGIISTAHAHGKKVFAYVDETRPRLQGARLTAWELQQLGIPHAVIVDGASGYIMKSRHVDLAVVGCDRVAANGDTANKIGTYNLAIVARAHGVPFYVAAPTSSIDLAIASGEQIEIEERSASEVVRVGAEQITPQGTQVANPAFDVTPAEYITAFVTEAGIARPPFGESLAEMVEKAKDLTRNV